METNTNKSFGYFAADEHDIEFDNTIRNTVRSKGSAAEMALYLQNQAILSMLRRILVKMETPVIINTMEEEQ